MRSLYLASPDSADHRLAHELAEAAGRYLVRLRPDFVGAKPDGADRRSNDFLLDRLAAERPADRVLSEESVDDPARVDADRVWIVDPLDGSREYAEAGRPDWAVHVALWADGQLAAGAVAVPATNTVLSTWRPPAAGPAHEPTEVLVSRSRPPAFLPALLDRWPAVCTPMGSAGAKTAAVLTGRASAYVHAGGQYEWDSAAPVAVAAHCGFPVRRIDGSVPVYNKPDPYQPDLAVCHPDVAAALWPALDALATGGEA